jgi:hypothetical protein
MRAEANKNAVTFKSLYFLNAPILLVYLTQRLVTRAIIRSVILDYTPRGVEHFKKSVEELGNMGLRQVVAPGLWNWNRFYPDYVTALENLRNFLTVAREEPSVEGFW